MFNETIINLCIQKKHLLVFYYLSLIININPYKDFNFKIFHKLLHILLIILLYC